MYYNNLNDNEENKDENFGEYYEFESPQEYLDTNLDNDFRFNDTDIEDDFEEFIPFYSCPLFRQQFPGGNYPPQMPPYGPPGGQQGMPPYGPPGGQQGIPPFGQQGMPSTPPPGFKPPKPQEPHMHGGIRPKAIDPAAIRRCRFRFSYIWLMNGNSFWAYLTQVGRTSASGYRWNGRRWVYFGINLRRIESFICY